MKKIRKSEKDPTPKAWAIILFSKEGRMFQRVNSIGAYDDFVSFPTKAEAEANIPMINAKWALSHLTAKAIGVASGFVGTPRD
jgi:hypothetical protein